MFFFTGEGASPLPRRSPYVSIQLAVRIEITAQKFSWKWLRTRPSCLFFGTLLTRQSFPLYYTLWTRPSCIIHTKIRLFLSVMPPKHLAHFFLYIPTKKPSFNDKVWTYYGILVSKRVKSRQTGKNWRTHEPHYRASAIQPFVGVNEMRVKNITVTVSVRVSVTVRVSLVWFVSSNSFGGVKYRHLSATVVSPVSDAIDTTVVSAVWNIRDTTVVSVTSTNFQCISNAYR